MEANNNQQIANRMINMLQKAGYTPQQMTQVLRLARQKYLAAKLNSKAIKN